MQHDQRRSIQILSVLVLITLALPVLSGTAFAKHEPKTYPESGKVIGGGVNQHTVNGPPMGSMGGTVQTKYSHTYKIETETRIYDLDCGKVPTWGSTGKGCGGKKPLELGDVIQFRTEKDSVYISLPDGSEQKLRILNQELKPEAKPADVKQTEVK